LFAFVEFDLVTRGESRIFAAITRGILDPSVEAAAQRFERMIPVVLWFSYDPVPLVAYAESEQEVMAMAKGLVVQYGGRVRRVMPLMRACALDVPMENRRLFAVAPGVRGLAYDFFVKVHSPERYMDIGEVSEVFEFEKLWDRGWTGGGVRVAVLDSGAGPDADVALTVFEGESPMDRFGHGTAVQRIIRSLSPDVHIISVAVLNELGAGRISDILTGMERAVMEGATLLNLSLGSVPALIDSLVLGAEILIRQYNVAIFASAGNIPEYTASPARSPLVVGVGAVGADLLRTEYSADGDVWSVGDQIVHWGTTEQLGRGTSFSCPVVLALWANYLSGNPEATPEETDELTTILAGSVESPEGLALASGAVAGVDPVPEPTLLSKLAHWLLVILVGLGVAVVALLWRE